MTDTLRFTLESQNDVLHVVDFGKVVLDGLLYAVLECHLGVWAGAAGALKLHFHHVVSGKFHKFNIATVLLKVGTDLFYDRFHFLFEGRVFHTFFV